MSEFGGIPDVKAAYKNFAKDAGHEPLTELEKQQAIINFIVEENKDNDVLYGVEWHEDSEYFGELVCPTINLFIVPGGKMSEKVPHNTPVRVERDKEYLDRTWYLVRTLDYKRKRGWVLDTMLKERHKANL